MSRKWKKRGNTYYTFGNLWTIIGSILCVGMMIWGVVELSVWYQPDRTIQESEVTNIILRMLGSGILLIVLIYISQLNQKIQNLLEQEKNLKQSQKVYYERLLEKEEETRRFRHDINGHMMCMHDMVTQKQWDDLREYLETLTGNLHIVSKKQYNSGNHTVDIFLSHYLGNIRDNVRIKIIGRFKEDIKVQQIDMSTIFDNLLKNVSEELNSSEEAGYFTMKINQGKQYIKVEMRNSICQDKERASKCLEQEKRSHGYGIKNMKRIVQKYDGQLQYEKTQEEFRVILILENKEESNRKFYQK